MSDIKKRLVIIGGGFAGLSVAKKIDKSQWEVTIVDRHNYHSFPPLFYQVASSELEPSGITFPLRREMRARKVKGCRYRMGTVASIDTASRRVITEFEEIPYDKVIIAAGATNNFFGIDGLPDRVYTLKSVPEAIRCRNAILERLERAALLPQCDERRALLTFVVVGGGPTGVEIAGALGEMKRYIIRRDYPAIDREEVKVVLCEGTDRLLRTMSENSSKAALKDLGQLMVDVNLGKTMKSYDGRLITFADGTTINSATLIWTAGITGEPIALTGTEVKAGPGGRFIVDEYNRVTGLDDVFAIGDISCHADERFPRGCPQLAQPAIQQGRTLAENLNRRASEQWRPFSYKDKGSMATIGRNRAVVDMGKLHFSGWAAWMMWMFIHLISLLGMRNRAVVLLNWIWSYFSFSTSLRMILKTAEQPHKKAY